MKNILYLFIVFPILAFSQHTIQGTFPTNGNFTYVMLYKSTPTSLEYVERSKMASDGNFKIDIPAETPAGIYKLVYGLPLEDYNFDLIYNGKEDVVLSYSDDEGLVFKESSENTLWMSYTKSMELVNMAISNFYKQESTDEKAFKDIFKTLKDTQNGFEDAAKGMMVWEFVKENRPYIPEQFEDVQTYSNNLKNTFLKHVDFSNPLLQSSEFLSDRVLAYVFGMNVSLDAEVYKLQIEQLLTTIGEKNDAVKMSLLETIWNQFISMENYDLANYVSDNYLISLAKSQENEKLLHTLIVQKNAGIGVKAKDFPINNRTLYDINISRNYVLIFWSSTCPHCLQELPKVQKIIKSYDAKRVKVIAYGIEDDATNWEKVTANYPEFIQVIGLEKWDNPLVKDYGIMSTPSYFVLDTNKKIIAKPDDADGLEAFLKSL
uniref:TlpA family protein disulfide reductase n=1 Tax=Gelidibacter sp. TaxID=2018083 RepID=UPI00404A405F